MSGRTQLSAHWNKTLFYGNLVSEDVVQVIRNIDLDTGSLVLPAAESAFHGELRWGDATAFGTPAYWKLHAWFDRNRGRYAPRPLGTSLAGELAACMLCGYGIPSEVGLAAFARLANLNLVGTSDPMALERALQEPLRIGARFVRYRFPKQKAKFMAVAIPLASEVDESMDPVSIRDFLTTLPGVGPKTASFVVRNRYGSNDVAVLDVHLQRACRALNLIEEGARDYYEMERQFLDFAKRVDVPASVLDNLIWDHMRTVGGFF